MIIVIDSQTMATMISNAADPGDPSLSSNGGAAHRLMITTSDDYSKIIGFDYIISDSSHFLLY